MDKYIARTLLLAPSKQKWTNYQQFYDFFQGRWPLFDQFIAFFGDFFEQFGIFPTPQVYEHELSAANDKELLDYIRNTRDDQSVRIHPEDGDFASALRTVRAQLFRNELSNAMRGLEAVLTGPTARLPVVQQGVNTMLAGVHRASQRLLDSDADGEIFFLGKRAQDKLHDDYVAIKRLTRNHVEMTV